MTAKEARNPMTAVGVIGLGLMGSAFASNLLPRGYEVHVYNRTDKRPSLSSREAPSSILLPRTLLPRWTSS